MIRCLPFLSLLLAFSLQAEPLDALKIAIQTKDAVAIHAAISAGANPEKVSPYVARVAIGGLETATIADKPVWRDLIRELAVRGFFPLEDLGWPHPYRGSIHSLAVVADETPLVTELLDKLPHESRCDSALSTLNHMYLRTDERGGRLAETERSVTVATLVPAEQRSTSICSKRIDQLVRRIQSTQDKATLLAILDLGFKLSPSGLNSLLANHTHAKKLDVAFLDQLIARHDVSQKSEQSCYGCSTPGSSVFDSLLTAALSAYRNADGADWQAWNLHVLHRGNIPAHWQRLTQSARCGYGDTLLGFFYGLDREPSGQVGDKAAARQLARQLLSDYLSHCPITTDARISYYETGLQLLRSGEGDLLALALRKGWKPNGGSYYPHDAPHPAVVLAREATCQAEPGVLVELGVNDAALLEIFLRCLPAPERMIVAEKHLATLAHLLQFSPVNEAMAASGTRPLDAAEVLAQPAIVDALRKAGAKRGKKTKLQRDFWLGVRLAGVANDGVSVSAQPPLQAEADETSRGLRSDVYSVRGLGKPLAPHYMLRGPCGNVNCRKVFLGRKVDGQYVVMLEGSGYDYSLGAMHKGLRDIKLTERSSAATHHSVLWRFDGKRYQRTVCTLMERDEADRLRTRRIKCDQ